MPSWDYKAIESSNRYLKGFKMNSDPSSTFGFYDFLEDNWQPNSFPSLTIPRCFSSTVSICPVFTKNQTIIGLVMVTLVKCGSYAWIYDSSLGTMSYTSLEAWRSYFLSISFHQSARAFFKPFTNCVGSNSNNFFYSRKCLCNFECLLV